jgi:hypothetical protein
MESRKASSRANTRHFSFISSQASVNKARGRGLGPAPGACLLASWFCNIAFPPRVLRRQTGHGNSTAGGRCLCELRAQGPAPRPQRDRLTASVFSASLSPLLSRRPCYTPLIKVREESHPTLGSHSLYSERMGTPSLCRGSRGTSSDGSSVAGAISEKPTAAVVSLLQPAMLTRCAIAGQTSYSTLRRVSHG